MIANKCRRLGIPCEFNTAANYLTYLRAERGVEAVPRRVSKRMHARGAHN